VTLLFLAIGLLLYLYYQHPEISAYANGDVVQRFDGEKITIFMTYILNEMPEGMRGLVTVGAIAAALSSTTSVLGAMASVAVEDFYRPWRANRDESHYVKAGRVSVLVFALLLSVMAMVSFFWQRYTDLPLLSFALGVMAFAYSGLLGVYFSAVFTKRGSRKTVLLALVGGFVTVLVLQPYILSHIVSWQIGFSWQLVIGTVVSFAIMQTARE
jgi:Na+/proline symporter